MNVRYHIAIPLSKEEIFELRLKAIREGKSVTKLVKELILDKIKEECEDNNWQQ